jgi:hypothetical protein
MSDTISEHELQKAKEAGIRFYSSQAEQELAHLKDGLARSDKERFLFLLNLMQLDRIMKNATFNMK